ncbi:MAG: ribonuclease activity regulator RraA, partial [Caldilineaceae bacterium]|nr:ribonuclease activity regulator RraA [Caldilineaceae bacterium]
QLNKRGLRKNFMAGIYPLRPDLRLVGYAFTLRYIPAREDLADELYDNTKNVQRLAVEAIGPGDVLVIDARGEAHEGATLGNILATRLKVRGAVGIVTDGALRDTPGFLELDLPSYIQAPHASTSFVAHHPVEMQTPIGCGGIAVIPGDVIVGDAEGVVVIPAAMAESVAHDAYEQEIREEFFQQKVASGSSILGVYPPNEQTLAEFEAWRKEQGK